jgi:predicted NAD-dependent protein-ADP-ribosyltransferase YbiA (DUF1768 family)
MEDLQNFVDSMHTDDDAVDEGLDALELMVVGTDDSKHIEALRTAVEEQRELLRRVQVALTKENNIDFSQLLDWTDDSSTDNLTSALRLSPLHISLTMCATMFNSIMHAFQASKVLYDKKYTGGDEEDFTSEQEKRMIPFATVSLSTANAWGGASGTINLDIRRWDADKTEIMRGLMIQACEQNPAVKSALLKTTGDIYEDTLPDNFWGHCKGQGQNTAGSLWMDIRDIHYIEPEKKRSRGSSSTGQSSRCAD